MSEFRLKRVEFLGSAASVLLQNENGPCPLLAIANALVLRGRLRFHPDVRCVTLAELVDVVADKVFELNPLSTDPTLAQQQTQQLHSVIGLIPTLKRGLDVNVKFSDATSFEYTQEFDVFDIFGISLYHGWVIDPQDTITYDAVHNLSYNELTTKIAEFRTCGPDTVGDSSSAAERAAMEAFYIDTAAQLTFYGLMRLYELVKERELCVFFRNDHFSTVFRIGNKLYSLVTDLGYEHVPEVVWELLDRTDGNTEFVNGLFQHQTASASGAGEDLDYLLALQLSQQEGQGLQIPPLSVSPPSPVRSTDNFNFTSTTVKRPSQSTTPSGKYVAGTVRPPVRPVQPALEQRYAGKAPRKSAEEPKSSCAVC